MGNLKFIFDNSFARDLLNFYVPVKPAPVPKPQLLFLNRELAEELGLDQASCDEQILAAIFSGNQIPEGAEPIAQAYAGHQFGHFSPQLGDGRALLIGEIIDRQGKRRDIAFKGSGRTPFSRRGDGKAALGPMLREVLIGEAMHALGIPTTRALAVVGTGDLVYREKALPGAVLTRIADSHIRVGTFEFFAASGDMERVRQLANYAIARHDPEIVSAKDGYLEFLRNVTKRQAALVAQWMSVGFIHGVMNTDNMSISGETIDYGPCAFMEAYNPKAVFSSIDEYGRYAFENQPGIAQWNLARMAEALLPLLADNEQQAVALATEVIETFPDLYRAHWLQGMRAKLGLTGQVEAGERIDAALVEEWLGLLKSNKADFTLAWRRLADAAEGNPAPLQELFCDQPALDTWLAKWQARSAAEEGTDGLRDAGPAATARAQNMRRANPWIIPRNHRVEEALDAASNEGNLEPFELLLGALKRPFEEEPSLSRYAEPASLSFTGSYRTFCGT